MSLPEWCEYICDVMDVVHLTSVYVSDRAEVSMKTMEKIRAINYAHQSGGGVEEGVGISPLASLGRNDRKN